MRIVLVLALLVACKEEAPLPPPAEKTDLAAKAKELAQRFVIVDGHVDIPYRLQDGKNEKGEITEDISQRTPKGDFDFVRAKEGGLDAPFMSIYVPAKFQETPGSAKKLADELIDMVEGFEKKWPDKFAVARTPEEVRKAAAAGKIALPMGIENGAALEDDPANVQHFYDRGVRYITLTHSKDNQLCDSSFDKSRTHQGLSELGRKVVAEMNRVGIMIDVSHVSDDTIRQVLELSQVPVIASHSSCRRFTPGFERNLSDELIQAIAEKGGVVMINFGSGFLSQAANEDFEKRFGAVRKFMADNKLQREDPKVDAFVEEHKKSNPTVYAKLDDVVAHIEHVVKLAGVDHVGFGSDFDGVGDSLPRGLEDVSKYPNLIRALLEKGYSEADIEKMCSGNVFRVWSAVAAHASTASSPR
jgi:membrane dipeptidase